MSQSIKPIVRVKRARRNLNREEVWNQMFAKLNGLNIHYVVEGEGLPRVIPSLMGTPIYETDLLGQSAQTSETDFPGVESKSVGCRRCEIAQPGPDRGRPRSPARRAQTRANRTGASGSTHGRVIMGCLREPVHEYRARKAFLMHTSCETASTPGMRGVTVKCNVLRDNKIRPVALDMETGYRPKA